MKKIIKTGIIVSLSSISILASAEYSIKISLEDEPIKFTNWQEYESIYGEWTNFNNLYGCSNWAPLPNEVTINLEFIQTATDCNQDQTRTVQNQIIDNVSNQIVNDGPPYTESRTITVSGTRQATGTMETWVATIPLYITDWMNKDGVYGCGNWEPSATTVNQGVPFTQNATDCEQDQIRTVQNREQETTTLAIRNIGGHFIETRTINNQPNSRTMTGTKSTFKYDANNYAECFNVPGPSPNTMNIHRIYYNGALVYSNTMTLSYYLCEFKTGMVLNGYTLGKFMGGTRWEVKKN